VSHTREATLVSRAEAVGLEEALRLSTLLTAGPKEARAWTIPLGATAPEAAGVIHTDFQFGFIKAEIVSFDDLMAAPMAELPGSPRAMAWHGAGGQEHLGATALLHPDRWHRKGSPEGLLGGAGGSSPAAGLSRVVVHSGHRLTAPVGGQCVRYLVCGLFPAAQGRPPLSCGGP
jgi:hypothetical protein